MGFELDGGHTGPKLICHVLCNSACPCVMMDGVFADATEPWKPLFPGRERMGKRIGRRGGERGIEGDL